jgi:hypothetical protein
VVGAGQQSRPNAARAVAPSIHTTASIVGDEFATATTIVQINVWLTASELSDTGRGNDVASEFV